MHISPAVLRALSEGNLENAITASTPGGIERQEAAGQAAMVASSRLPKEGMNREVLERLGFVIGEDADDLFVNVTLPSGWALKPTDHSMHTDIVDDKGRTRGGVFYKAAFYDRRADMHLTRRYTTSSYFACDADGNPVHYSEAEYAATVVLDGDKPIHYVGINSEKEKRDKSYYERKDAQEDEATEWLKTNFPDYMNAEAYWD
jgi:hypothetical protein